jgi:CheY-like chemotaxis protein
MTRSSSTVPPVSARPLRVLVIDDNEVDRERIRRALGATASVREATTAAEGLDACEAEAPDVVLLDHRLPDGDGVDLIAPLLDHGVAIVMLSGQGNEELAVSALQRGAHDYVSKDRLVREGVREALESSLRHAMRARDLQTLVRRQQAELLRSESQLRLMVDHLPMAVWTTDHLPVVTSVSGGERAGPFDAVRVGQAPWESLAEAHRTVLRTGEPVRTLLEQGGRRIQTELRALRGAGVVFGVLGVARDVTDRPFEVSTSQARDDGATRVATAVSGALSGLVARLGAVAPTPELRALLDEVSGVVRQLDAVARRRSGRPTSLHPGEVLAAQVVEFGRRLGQNIDVHPTVPAGLWSLRLDPTWLPELFAAVADNIREALPSGGSLSLSLANVTVEVPRFDVRGGQLEAGRYVGFTFVDAPRGKTDHPARLAALAARTEGLAFLALDGLLRQGGGSLVVDGESAAAEIRLLLPTA